MATGFKAKAVRRDSELVVPAIEGFLKDEDPKGALDRAVRAIKSETEKLRAHRPAAAALLDAQLAGWLAGTAAGIHSCDPRRPPGKRHGMPDAAQLQQVFQAAYLQVTGESDD